jgi:hypothetical protein
MAARKTGRRAARSWKGKRPSSERHGGSPATSRTGFLPGMLQAGAGQQVVDGVAIRPYGQTPQDVLAGVRAARETLSALRLSTVPLYVTEFGWTTQPSDAWAFLSESLRSSYIAQTISALGHTNCGIAATLIYTWVTPEQDPGNPEDWFGIHPPNGANSPDAQAFATGIRQAAQPATPLRVCG